MRCQCFQSKVTRVAFGSSGQHTTFTNQAAQNWQHVNTKTFTQIATSFWTRKRPQRRQRATILTKELFSFLFGRWQNLFHNVGYVCQRHTVCCGHEPRADGARHGCLQIAGQDLGAVIAQLVVTQIQCAQLREERQDLHEIPHVDCRPADACEPQFVFVDTDFAQGFLWVICVCAALCAPHVLHAQISLLLKRCLIAQCRMRDRVARWCARASSQL